MPKTVYLPRASEVKQNPLPTDKADDRYIRYISFFGDASIPADHPEYKRVYSLAKRLAQEGYGIVNGGGPGVMEAATQGAESVDGHTVAIYWEPQLASHFEGKYIGNQADESASYPNYMMRTLGLIEKAQAYICCIGGTGTVSEFGMVWGLAKMYFGRHKPVILYGDFWHKIVDAFYENMLIDDEEMAVLYYANDEQRVLELLQQFETEIESREEEDLRGEEAAFVIDPRSHATRHAYTKHAQLYRKERAGRLVSQVQLDEFMTYVPSGSVLDIGSGPGFDIAYLAQKYETTGIELVEEFCKLAERESPTSKIICGDVISIDLPKESYDGIWSRDALHHIPAVDQDKTFQRMADALKPGGVLYLIVQEGEGEGIHSEQRAGHALRRFYHYYTQDELQQRATKAGLRSVKTARVIRSHKWLIGVFRKPEQSN